MRKYLLLTLGVIVFLFPFIFPQQSLAGVGASCNGTGQSTCGTGNLCVNGTCEPGKCDTGGLIANNGCTQDYECSGSNGVCVPKPCVGNATCTKPGDVCKNNECIPKNQPSQTQQQQQHKQQQTKKAQQAQQPQTGTIQCTCDNPGISNGTTSQGNQIVENTYHCGTAGMGDVNGMGSSSKNNTYTAVGYCSHAEEGCINATGSKITPQRISTNTNGTLINNTYEGVTCTNNGVKTPSNSVYPNTPPVSCACGSNNNVICKNYTGKTIGTYQTTCTSTEKCVQSNNIYKLKNPWNQAVRGAACVEQCTCNNGGGTVGTGNNGWTCKDGTSGACHNQEDMCKGTYGSTPIPLSTAPYGPTTGNGTSPGGWKSVSCINNTSCGCQGNIIACTSIGSGPVDPEGNNSNEYFQYDCGSQLCVSGPQYGTFQTKVFNQYITGIGCKTVPITPIPPLLSPPCSTWSNGQCTTFASAFGTMQTDPAGFIKTIFGILLSASGGIALLLIIKSGYQILTSRGKPEQIQQGRDQLIAAIVGLVFLIFSFVFLQLIGFDILKIPGFGQ